MEVYSLRQECELTNQMNFADSNGPIKTREGERDYPIKLRLGHRWAEFGYDKQDESVHKRRLRKQGNGFRTMKG